MTSPSLSMDDARRQIHDIIRNDDPFEQKATKVLELAVASLNVDYGLITQIDTETDHWEVVITTDQTGEVIPPDLERDLQKTYCRKTVTDEGPHAIHDAIAEGWADDPALETRDHHTYLGIPLIPEDTPYGTVCFESEDSREQPFTETETLFADHVTRLIERELKRERIEDELASHTNFAAVMNRVLRHNLRNNITVLRGRIQLLAESTDGVDAIEDVFDYIDEIIDLSEKARKLERIITADTESHTIAIESLIEEITGEVAREHPEASIALEYDESITATVRKDFDLAITELLENAVKHSGEQSTVSVSIEKQPNTFEIEISDDGPGIPKMEAEVLSTGRESPLTHGSGLGLWTVHWIVSQHDGSIDTHVTDEGTTISISIPRQPEVQIAQNRSEIIRGRDRFQAAFNETHDSIVILDNDARVINCNAAAADLFGTDEQALLGQPLRAYAVDQSEFDAKWRHFQTSGTNRGEMMFVDTDGAERIVEYSGQNDIIPGEHVFVARDITERREREQELRETNSLLSTLYETAPVGVTVLNTDGEFIRANDHAEAVLGLSKSKITGRTYNDLSWELFGEDGEAVPDEELPFAQVMATEEPMYEKELGIRWPNGTERWLSINLAPLKTESGEIDRVVAVISDITEQREHKRELTALKERYETLLEAAPDPVFVAEAETGEIIDVNEAAESLIGAPQQELIGRHYSTFHPPEDADMYRKTFDRIAGERTTVQQLPDGSRPEVLTADGDTIPIEMSVDTVSLPDGEVIFGIFRDISDRVEREAELRAKTRAMDEAPIGITLTDPHKDDNPMIYTNQKFIELTGYPEDEIIGRNCRFVQGEETDPETVAEIRSAIDDQQPVSTTIRNYRKDGTPFWNRVQIAPVMDESGEITNWVGFQEDLTER